MLTRAQVEGMTLETRKAYVAMCRRNLVHQREQVQVWNTAVRVHEELLLNATGALVRATTDLVAAELMVKTMEGVEL